MKYFILGVITFSVFIFAAIIDPAHAERPKEQCKFMYEISPYQKEVAYQAYRAGEPYDLGLTMVAIAWQESKLGLYKVRWGDSKYDMSFGVMHTVAYWKTKNMSIADRSQWIQSMIADDIRSINIGLQDVLYWQQRAKGDWRKGVAMYNGGGNGNYVYADNVLATVRNIKDCEF